MATEPDDVADVQGALRCALCGAPLGLAAAAVTAGGAFDCAYCGAANLVESRATRLARRNAERVIAAAEEARDMYADMEPRRAVIEEALAAAYVAKDLERALFHHEALLRLVMVPQVHILRAADQNERWVQRAYRELDATVAQTLARVRAEWAESGRASQ